MSQSNPANGRGAAPDRTKFVLLLIGAFLLVFVAGVSVGALEWWYLSGRQQDQARQAQPATTEQGPKTGVPPAASPTASASAAADSLFKVLDQRAAKAAPGELAEITEALVTAENNYPTDYRFPYTHAKLVVTGGTHPHAFGLLNLAGQRAIDAGQADRLVADMNRDKDGAFYRCSRGHEEWKTLLTALKSKDKGMLENTMEAMHNMDLMGGASALEPKY